MLLSECPNCSNFHELHNFVDEPGPVQRHLQAIAKATLSSEFCAGTNRDGSRCGNRVATFSSGVFVVGPYCHVHRKKRREAKHA